MRKTLLISTLLIMSCNQESEAIQNNESFDSINTELAQYEIKQDSLADIRRLNDLNSVNQKSRNETFFKPTVNFSVKAFNAMKDSSITQIEDLLIVNNWLFTSKTEGDSKAFIKPSDIYTYQNYSNDSELLITVIGEKKLFQLYTLNPYNFKYLTKQLNDLGFSTESGTIMNTPRIKTESVKYYVGEVIPIDFNTKIYKKNGFEITSTSYINSVVEEVFKTNDTLNTYGYKYNVNNQFNSFAFTF